MNWFRNFVSLAIGVGIVSAAALLANEPANAQVSAGYDWRNWSDSLIFDQGKDFRDFAKEGKAFAGGEPTARGAYDRFIYLCEKQDTQGCVYAVDTARELMSDPMREIGVYEIACENGEAKFCGAGYMSTKADDKPAFDRIKAEQFAKKGCNLGDQFLCKGEAWLVSLRKDGDLTPGETLARETKYCDEDGRRASCYYVGWTYAGFTDETKSQKNIELAQRYLNRACNDGDRRACNDALIVNDPDQGYPANPDGMDKALSTLCLLSDANLCTNGLFAYVNGTAGVAIDDSRAAFFAGVSCDRFQEDCHAAAYYRKQADPSNMADIVHYAGKACELGNPDGCLMKGNLLLRGDQEETAMQAYRRACSLGKTETCAFINKTNAAIARRARLDAEYERCRGGCPAGMNSAAADAPKAAWEPSYCASHRQAWRRARDTGQPYVKSAACGVYR